MTAPADRKLPTALLCLLVFISGGVALIYEVTWVRSLIPVLGSSHLAVTTVVSVFMAGLGWGGALVARRRNVPSRLLRLYGMLELGVAVAALFSLVLFAWYPSLYAGIAGGIAAAPLSALLLRIVLAGLALLLPTTLLGATLPVLAAYASRDGAQVGLRVALLYGCNTIGAMAGTLAAGLFLLPRLHVSGTMGLAMSGSLAVGVMALLLSRRSEVVELPAQTDTSGASVPDGAGSDYDYRLPLQLAFWGAAISGFCALGDEVLWTRMLAMMLGASVYGFTLILAAFLGGMGLGACVWGGIRRRLAPAAGRDLAILGGAQLAAGGAALLATTAMAWLPVCAASLQQIVGGGSSASGRFWVTGLVAVAYVSLPAFFFGIAFPLAVELHVRSRRSVGAAVGSLLAVNTFGSIAGAAVSGFLLVYLVGIERSLQLLALVNIGYGLLLLLARQGWRQRLWGGAVLWGAAMLLLAANPTWVRFWDQASFAIYRTSQSSVFADPARARAVREHTTVLYHAEGVEASVSSIFAGGVQTFLVNGRPEASTSPGDRQLQYSLGHLPMLFSRQPRSACVLGLGSGMTLGSLLAYPELERVTVAELEPKVVGVAKSFKRYNRDALSDPRVRLVFNDGRNQLLASRERYDVITADPIHPWFSGAGYLYTREYYRLAASRLNPGGVICQWLPIYELQPRDLRAVVRTFRQQFRYSMVWLTHQDLALLGSDAPFSVDLATLSRRLQLPAVTADLAAVQMGTPVDLLGYFLMGEQGMDAFSREGVINTDDNLFLEFSAPLSISVSNLMRDNLAALGGYREAPAAYLAGVGGSFPWLLAAGRELDQAHLQFLGRDPAFPELLPRLNAAYPAFGRWDFMRREFTRVTGIPWHGGTGR